MLGEGTVNAASNAIWLLHRSPGMWDLYIVSDLYQCNTFFFLIPLALGFFICVESKKITEISNQINKQANKQRTPTTKNQNPFGCELVFLFFYFLKSKSEQDGSRKKSPFLFCSQRGFLDPDHYPSEMRVFREFTLIKPSLLSTISLQ